MNAIRFTQNMLIHTTIHRNIRYPLSRRSGQRAGMRLQARYPRADPVGHLPDIGTNLIASTASEIHLSYHFLLVLNETKLHYLNRHRIELEQESYFDVCGSP